MDDLLLLLMDRIHGGSPPLRQPEDLLLLDAKQLLSLADLLPDALLPAFVGLIKSQGSETGLFQRLMGEHEEELRTLSDRFFQRYMDIVLNPDDDEDFNPLLFYLPPDMFHDLALLQSRESFFKRQTIAVINDFLQSHFQDPPVFEPGAQDAAWNYFFGELLRA